MLNGLVLFAKTGGTTLALEDIVRPTAYHCLGQSDMEILFSRIKDGKVPSNPVTDDIQQLRSTDSRRIDVLHGSLPTEAEYARIVRRELGTEPGNLYEQIYELAKEIKPKFLFFELKRSAYHSSELRRIVSQLARISYDFRSDPFSAYDVGSPQKRERVYLLARKREGVDSKVNGIPSNVERGSMVRVNEIEAYSQFEYDLPNKRTPERVAEVKAGIEEVCVPQYREAFLRLVGLNPHTRYNSE